MKKIILQLSLTSLVVASLFACGPTAQSPADPGPTLAPSPEPTPVNTAWTSFPDIQSIRALAFDKANNLWAVGPDGAVMIKPDGTREHFTTDNGLPSNDLLSVGFDTQGNAWVGTSGDGIARYDGAAWQTFTTQDGLGGNKVLAITYYLESSGVLLGTNNGFSVYRDWEGFTNPVGLQNLPSDEVRAIAILRGDNIWLGTANGLSLFDTTQIYNSTNGLVGNQVNTIAIAPDCTLWVGTEEGVSHYISGSLTSYTTVDGLADNAISSAAASLDGTAWFGTRAGLSGFDGNSWTTYTTADGLADNNVLSIVVAPDETLWIGTAGGLSHFAPARREGTISTRLMDGISGLNVIYPKNGDLWLWSDGSTRQITKDGNVAGFKLSDDRTKVAFTRQLSYPMYELWVINFDGTGERLLLSVADLAALGKPSESEEIRQEESYVLLRQYTWVPGTHTIVYSTYRSIRYDGSLYHDDMYLVDADTGEKSPFLPPGSAGIFSYSPDGSRISLNTQDQLSIMDADGTHRRDKLFEFHTSYLGDTPIYPRITWSADGTYLLVSVPPEDLMAYPSEPTTFWKVPADGSPATRSGATQYPIFPPGYNVSYSPDLTHLAYTAESKSTSPPATAIHIANIDGSADRVVQTGGMLYFWGWSPDGQKFIYYSHPNPDAWYISDLQGNATVLDFLPVDIQVSWVNDQAFLYNVHCGEADCAYELRLTSMDGETLVLDRSWTSPWFTFFFK